MKKLHITFILFLCLCSVYAQFNGEGYYRIQNELVPTEYIAFQIPKGPGLSMSKSLDESTIVLIKENVSNPGKYTIFKYDRTRYLEAKGRPPGRPFPANGGRSIDDLEAVLDIQTTKVKGSYAIAFSNANGTQKYVTLKKFPEKPNDVAITGSTTIPKDKSRGPIWKFIQVPKNKVKGVK